jgi:hypothetical protein
VREINLVFHVMTQYVAQRRRWVRRLGVGLAGITMVAGLAACGGDGNSSGDDAMTAASSNLEAAKVVSFGFRLVDPDGVVVKSADDPEMAKKLVNDATVTFTVDPVGDNTLGQTQGAASISDAQALKQAGAWKLVYEVAGTPMVDLRLVDGAVYLKLDRMIAQLGEQDLDATAKMLSGDLPELSDALKNGKWVKIDLARILEQHPEVGTLLSNELGPDASTSAQVMPMEFLAALNENSEKTVSSDGDTTTVELKVKAKEFALAVEELTPMADAASEGDVSGKIEKLGDGTVDMSVTVTDDHLTEATLDLASAQGVLEPDSDVDLTGAQLVVDINDAAEGVTAPAEGDVVDVTDALLERVAMLSSLMGNLNAMPSEMGDLDTIPSDLAELS